jgi:hypothetical protein
MLKSTDVTRLLLSMSNLGKVTAAVEPRKYKEGYAGTSEICNRNGNVLMC